MYSRSQNPLINWALWADMTMTLLLQEMFYITVEIFAAIHIHQRHPPCQLLKGLNKLLLQRIYVL
jgi:hypothetical protein